MRLIFDERPVADTLHLTTHNNMADNVAAHTSSPASISVIVSALADVDARGQPVCSQCDRTTQYRAG
jgi:hypothetical protein